MSKMPDLRKRTLFVASGQMVAMLSATIVAMVLSRILDKGVYGTYRQTFEVYRTVLAIMGLNLGASMLFFLPRSESEQERKSFMGQSLVLGGIVGLLIGSVLLFGSTAIAGAISNLSLVPLLMLLLPYAILNQVTLLVPRSLVASDRASLVLPYNLVNGIGRSACIITTFAMKLPIEHVIVAVVAWEVVIAGFGIFLLSRAIGITFHGIGWESVGRQLAYTCPLLAAVMVGQLAYQFDKAVIAVTFDTETFAEYANGAIQIPMVMLVVATLATSITPEMSKLAGRGNIDGMLNLWRTAAAKGGALVFPMAAFCLLSADYIVVLLYGPKYVRSAIPFAIYCSGLFLRITYFGTVLRAVGRTRLEMVAAAVALVSNVAITLSIVYVGRGTIWAFAGPAIGTVAGQSLSIAALLILISRVTGRPMLSLLPLRQLGKAGLVTLAAVGGIFWVRLIPGNVVVKILSMFFLFTAIYTILAVRFGVMSEGDVAFVRRVLVRLRPWRKQE